MKDIIKLLKKLKLSNTEIALYLNGLRYQTIGVAKLVELSNIKRTTAYHALATLVEKGLAAEFKQDGRLMYRMTPGDELARLLENRKEQIQLQIKELNTLLPQFPQFLEAPQNIPEVVNYYGQEGVRAAVDRALYAHSRRWRIMSPKNNFFSNSSSEYIEYFKSKRKERGIQAKSLWESSIAKVAFTEEEVSTRQPRIMPPKLDGTFRSTIILFDDYMLVISSYGRQFATLIQSEETVQTFNAMFDTIWDISTDVQRVPQANV